MVYCISYDLRKSGRNYESLYEAIKSYGTWWHQTGSVWFVVSSDTAANIRDRLNEQIDSNDKLFVIALQKRWAGVGFSQREYEWLKSIPDVDWD